MFYAGILGFILTAAGVYLAVRALGEIMACQECRKWAFIQGKMTRAKTKATGKRFTPDVTYEYTVNGRDYKGSLITPGKNKQYPTRHKANLEIKTLDPGSEVMVFYDPQDPARAVLQPAVTYSARTRVMMGFIFAVCGLVALAGSVLSSIN